MIKLFDRGFYLKNGNPVEAPEGVSVSAADRRKTIAYRILEAHNQSGDMEHLRVRFDSLISHDITYVGIIQTARASGLAEFPLPYVLTNCHNSLCAVGGTINEDDHVFGLSAAKKYGGVYVPANLAVIHQYAREMMAGCGKMILGSDSHTRYGALGTMAMGEGGPELVKQLLSNTYDVNRPDTVLVYLTGSPRHGVGPHDVAIALCGAVYDNGFVKNKVLEFVGPGITNLPMDFRIGIDVMTTETACLSSIWETDAAVQAYLSAHGRPEAYAKLAPEEGAYYDAFIEIDLSSIEPMAALPFHPSKAYPIRLLCENAGDIFREIEREAAQTLPANVRFSLTDKLQNGKIVIEQGIIAGCAGGMFDNIAEAAAILDGASVGNSYFSLSVYPSSVPISLALMNSGIQQQLMEAGALFKSAFCGPCFGAGDAPANNTLSIRHTTRNFPSREGSKPSDGQISGVVLMDARSIAATAKNGGLLTSAADLDYEVSKQEPYAFDGGIYEKRVYSGFGSPKTEEPLRMGPNIAEWPKIPALAENAFFRLASVIRDPVTTTDELIPSGETSSYRSNPLKLASFTLSRRDPHYVVRAKEIADLETARAVGEVPQELLSLIETLGLSANILQDSVISSVLFANKPGDGSAREQAASSQRVLGGGANICYEFATKRYRSNCINWGMLPFVLDAEAAFPYAPGDWIFVPGLKTALEDGAEAVDAKIVTKEGVFDLKLNLPGLTAEDREIILRGCLMNYYAARRA